MALAAVLLSCCGNTSSSWLASALGLRPSASLLILGCMMAALANCLLLSSKTLCAIKINKFIFKKKKKDPTYSPFLSTCWGLTGEKLLFPRRMLTWVHVVSGKFALWLLPQRPRPLPWWKMSWPEPVPLFSISWDGGDWSPWERPGCSRRGLGEKLLQCLGVRVYVQNGSLQ